MAVKVDIYLNDVYGLIDAGYELIKVYRSLRRNTDYSEVTSSSTRIPIDITTPRYVYSDVLGNEDMWYKYSLYTDTGPSESSLSDPLRGTTSGTNYRGASYPPEMYLSSEQQDMINRVRQYVGDIPEVTHDYLSASTSYDNVSTDGYTLEMDNPPGWPLSIAVNGTAYTTINDPIVRGYQFVTFSGTQINTTSGVVDLWYHHFRFSDRQVVEAYSCVELPAGIVSAMATPEMFELQAAIKLLELELRNFMATSSSSVSIYEEISIDPSSGLRARQEDLNNLRKKLQDLVKAAMSNNLTIVGVRLD